MEIAVRVVDDFAQGVEHIQRYNSGHTEVIVSESAERQQAFLQQIHSAVVMVNASSRFSDGGELGLEQKSEFLPLNYMHMDLWAQISDDTKVCRDRRWAYSRLNVVILLFHRLRPDLGLRQARNQLSN